MIKLDSSFCYVRFALLSTSIRNSKQGNIHPPSNALHRGDELVKFCFRLLVLCLGFLQKDVLKYNLSRSRSRAWHALLTSYFFSQTSRSASARCVWRSNCSAWMSLSAIACSHCLILASAASALWTAASASARSVLTIWTSNRSVRIWFWARWLETLLIDSMSFRWL